MRTCEIPDCDRPHLARGWCRIHYDRWWSRGTTDLAPPTPEPFPGNLLSRLEHQENGCILFTGGTNDRGYGQVQREGRVVYAHRAAYELFVGPIPEGHVLDHTCHNEDPTCNLGDNCPHRRCVNTDHMQPTTRGENVRRGKTTRERVPKPRLATIPRRKLA